MENQTEPDSKPMDSLPSGAVLQPVEEPDLQGSSSSPGNHLAERVICSSIANTLVNSIPVDFSGDIEELEIYANSFFARQIKILERTGADVLQVINDFRHDPVDLKMRLTILVFSIIFPEIPTQDIAWHFNKLVSGQETTF